MLIVLWTVAILLILAATTRQTSALDTKLSVFTTQEMRCKWAARAGVEKAVAILNEDDRTVDSPADLWSKNPQDLVDVPLQGCHYTVRVVDESGKLNVNTATRDQLLGLQDWGMEPAIADAIIDWRDADDTPGEEGTEAGYYENLTYPYVIRNGPFKTIRELLKVRGVTEDLFYGKDPNVSGPSDTTARNGGSASQASSGATAPDQAWIGLLTCYASSSTQDPTGATQVNINQATADELQQQLGITAAQAQSIVQNRPSSGYTSIGDLIGSTTPQTPQTLVHPLPAGQATVSPSTCRRTVRSWTTSRSALSRPPPRRRAASSGSRLRCRRLHVGFRRHFHVCVHVHATTANSTAAVAASKVNVNTAPVEVLVALWGGTDLAYELASNVMSYRDATLLGMQSIGELLDVPSMTVDAFKQAVDLVAIRSNVFSIVSTATADQTGISGASWVVEAVVDRGQSPVKILYWYEGACP